MKSLYIPEVVTNVNCKGNPMDLVVNEYTKNRIYSGGHEDKHIVRHVVHMNEIELGWSGRNERKCMVQKEVV